MTNRPAWAEKYPHDTKIPAPLSDTAPLWTKQPRETDKAFGVFVIYRDQGGKRKVSTVAKIVGKSETQLYRWHSRWSWIDRALAYDQWIDMERAKDRLSAAKEGLDDLVKMGQALAVRSYNALLQSFSVDEKGNVTSLLSHSDLIKLHGMAIETWRHALGIPDRIETQVTGPGGGPQQQEVTVKFDLSDVAEALGVLRDVGAVRLADPPGANGASIHVLPSQTDS